MLRFKPFLLISRACRRRYFWPLIGLVAFPLAIFLAVSIWNWPLNPQQTIAKALGSDRLILDREGKVLQVMRTDFTKRRLIWQGLEQFSQDLQAAVIASEDQRFYRHLGIDPIGLVRALKVYWTGGGVQGASTITMQLADLIDEEVLVRGHRIKKGSLLHKMSQMQRAVLIEWLWTKQEILEAYLNLIHLKGEYQGASSVAQAYFRKPVLTLDQAEAAVLAASISSPNQGRKTLEKKSCLLYKKLAVRPCEDNTALVRAIDDYFRPPGPLFSEDNQALQLARRLLKGNPTEGKSEGSGASPSSNSSVLRTTISLSLQKEVLEILDRNIAALRDRKVQDSAAIVIENSTGKVLAYVGSVSSSKNPHVDGVTALRQAGSTLKPFLYAKAIDNRSITAASVLLDDDTAISWSGGVYRPTNYDRTFHGPVSAREALASSLNVPAVKIVTMIGLHESYKVLDRLHFSFLKEPDFYGVSMALGAVEVRLDELSNAYRTFANRGQWSPLQFGTDSQGSLGEGHPQTETVFSDGASAIIASILSDPEARAMGFGLESPLETAFWTAVKTGTSKDYRDNWCIGFSNRYTVGVWAGNFDATAMEKVSGVSGAGPAWYEIMNLLHRSERSEAPPLSKAVTLKKIRHPWRSQTRDELFLVGTEPAAENIEVSTDQSVQFVFPADRSVLVVDPRLDPENVALFVRFKGQVPPESSIYLGKTNLGPALSPLKILKVPLGEQSLEIKTKDNKILSRVQFFVKGIQQ